MNTANVVEKYILVCLKQPDLLEGYEFVDRAHAIHWMSQKFVTDDIYHVRIETVTYSTHKCPNCGYTLEANRAVRDELPASAFLAYALEQEHAP